MEQVFSYIIGLGAAVMMPIIFTILGVCIGIKFSKALKSGLLVGVGYRTSDQQSGSGLKQSGRNIWPATESIRYGMACCCSRSL